jgi:beta-mannanase
MKTTVIRLSAVVLTIVAGCTLFLGFLNAGESSQGPLQDLLSTLNNQVAKTENNLMDKRESRSQSMKWFNEIRNNKTVINTIDTILLGAYDDATQESYENIITLEDSLKTKLPIISVYTAWGSKKDQVFPMLRAQAIYDLGSIPMITWEPWLNDFDPKRFSFNAQAVNKNKGGLRAVAEGRYDDYIDKWAMDAKKFGLPFYLRWGHEMNDPYRYPWGQQNNAPEDYIDAWRYVVQRFRQVGATNVIWIWSPHPAYPFDLFYPGDEYVDWTALTALNYGTVATWSQWWSFNDIIGKAYKKIAVYGKPVMLAEFGSLEVGGNRSLWYKDALGSLPQKYPAVRALVFFHASNDLSTTYKALDWSFEHDKKVLDSAKAALAKW